MCLRGEFRAMIHISNETRSTKHPKIGHIRLVTSDKVMRSFLQELMKINLVDDMAVRGVSFAPDPNWGLVFSKHCSGHFTKSAILPFNNTILLRCISSREFMSEAIFIKKFFDMSIFLILSHCHFGYASASNHIQLELSWRMMRIYQQLCSCHPRRKPK